MSDAPDLNMCDDGEIQKLILLAMVHQPATDAQICTVLSWANNARGQNAMVDCLLSGHLEISGFVENEPQFRLTQKGERDAKTLVGATEVQG